MADTPERSDAERGLPARIQEQRELPPATPPPRDEVRQVSPDLDRILQVAIAGAGTAALMRRLSPEQFAEILATGGDVAMHLRASTTEPLSRFISGISSGRLRNPLNYFRTPTPTAPVPELLAEARQIERKLSSIYGGAAFEYRAGAARVLDLHRDALAVRYRAAKRGGLTPLTVSELLSDQSLQGKFGKRVVDEFTRMTNAGILTGEMALSPQASTFGFYRGRNGRFLDTQWADPRRAFDAVYKMGESFRIPVLDISPTDLLLGPVRPFVMGPARHATIGSNITLPNGVRTGKGLVFSLGGDIWSEIVGQQEFEKIASGVTVMDVSRKGTQFYATAASAWSGTMARNMDRVVSGMVAGGGSRGWFARAQRDLLGFGPAYQTEEWAGGRIYRGFERLRGNEATWVPNEFTSRGARARGRGFFKGVLGEHIDIQAGAAARGMDPEAALAEAVRNEKGKWSDLGALEKLQAAFEESPYGKFYKEPPDLSTGFRGLPHGGPVHRRHPAQGFTGTLYGEPAPIGAYGVAAKSVPATGVVLPGNGGAGDLFNLFMHHSTVRLNALIGATTGMGFRPTPGKYGWVGNLAKIYGMAAVANMGVEYAKYADYLAGQAMSILPGVGDTRPSQYAVGLYGGAMRMRQKVREAVGIQQLASYSEGLMPGSVSSPASWFARTVLPTAAGYLARGRAGALAGAAIGQAIGGADVAMSSADMARIHSGSKLVPVRSGRWWSVGLTPWGGGKITHYRPSWISRYTSGYEYTDTLYGSGSEYFSYASSAPTPHNLFGLTKFLRPDYYSKKHYATRPYPYSETGSPMHQGEALPPELEKGTYDAAYLGLPTYSGTYTQGLDPSSLGSKIRRTTNYVTELGGLYKWFAEQMPFYGDLFGEGRDHEQYAATASTITSKSRRFYDEELGGALGMTELLRRFLHPDQGKQGLNFVPNTMPGWLPGSRAEDTKDKFYFMNFHQGDPYASIQGGEYRLPGRAYESMRPLHSGIPGVYDAMDRYLILADVAPWSNSFKDYRTIVKMWADSGTLDVSWQEKFQETEKQVETVIIPQYQPRIFSGVKSGTLEELARVNKYSLPERVIGAGWEMFTHDFIPGVGRTVPVIGTYIDRKLLGQRSAYESYLENQIYASDFQDWERPWSGFVKPRITNLVASSPPVAALGGASLGMFFGFTPLGRAAGLLGGATVGAASMVRMASTGHMRGGWIPSDVKEAQSEEQYFDALAYERYKRLNAVAVQQGNLPEARKFEFAMKHTAVGMNYNVSTKEFLESARYKVGPQVKDYMWHFAQAPEESRGRIMEVLPAQARPLMGSIWARRGDSRYQTAPSENQDAAAQELLNSRGMPAPTWPGWNPSMPMDAIKIRTLDSVHGVAYDLHRHNLWKADRAYTDRTFPSLEPAF